MGTCVEQRQGAVETRRARARRRRQPGGSARGPAAHRMTFAGLVSGIAVAAITATAIPVRAGQAPAAVAARGPAGATEQAEQEVCGNCHATDQLRTSVHGAAVPCLACHQDDRHREIPRDPVSAARRRSATCAACHETLEPSHAHVAEGAPLCTDCHSAHRDPPIEDATAALARRCGSCHEAELSEFLAGAHAAAIADDSPNPDLPDCMTCHPSHVPAGDRSADARLHATALCIQCHSSELLIGRYDLPAQAGASYEDDFHGSTLQFLWRHPAGDDQPDVMVCSDCHGAHRVEWLARAEVTAVCLGCHEAADEKIAGAWLGHQPVSRDNAVLVWAVRIFYYIFIPLVLGGLLLHILFEVRHQRRHAPQHRSTRKATVRVTRFSPIERMEHLLSMTSFTLLVLTGLPQSYPGSSLGNWFIQLWGGIASTRLIHRVTGVLFVTLLVVHVTRAAVAAIRGRRLPIMFANRKDFADAWQTLRHFMGRARAPRVGKFDFREKFEYWGLFLGGILMSVTGFILLFPEGASQLLPGAVLAAARVMHGLEATFAVLVVILWHSWGVIFRPEVFPLDTSIFTGKISLERLEEEHALEYERIFGTRPAGESGQTT